MHPATAELHTDPQDPASYPSLAAPIGHVITFAFQVAEKKLQQFGDLVAQLNAATCARD